jgi:hypothetical protein
MTMAKAKMATKKTTAPKRNNEFRVDGYPKKYTNAWRAEHWMYEYEKLLQRLAELDYHLRMAQGYNINGKISKSFDEILSARGLYKDKLHEHRWSILPLGMTVEDDTESLNLAMDEQDRSRVR